MILLKHMHKSSSSLSTGWCVCGEQIGQISQRNNIYVHFGSSGGFRGGSRGSLKPPLEPNYFIFMGNLKKF